MKQKSWLPIYLLLGLVWGSSFVFIKLGLEFLTPVGVAFGRCALGAMILLLIVKIRGIKLPTDARTWLILWIVSLLLNVFPGFLFAYAQQEVTTVLAGIINAFTPLATLVFIFIFFRCCGCYSVASLLLFAPPEPVAHATVENVIIAAFHTAALLDPLGTLEAIGARNLVVLSAQPAHQLLHLPFDRQNPQTPGQHLGGTAGSSLIHETVVQVLGQPLAKQPEGGLLHRGLQGDVGFVKLDA